MRLGKFIEKNILCGSLLTIKDISPVTDQDEVSSQE